MYSRRIIKELKFFIIKEIIMKRASGILLPVFSLPSPYGIGTIYSGKKFIDFLSNAAQRYWQILPLGPVGACNSPYQTFSAFAGNPLLIDPGELMLKGLLSEEEEGSARVKSFNAQVDYALVEETFTKLFRLAFSRADKDEINKYMKKDSEIYEYSLFMAIKESLSGAPLCDWPEDIRLRKPSALLWYSQKLRDEMLYHAFLQMEFFSQWADLKQYANEKGIRIIGDIPMYVSRDSADFWCHPEMFLTDEKGNPPDVAGVPPDYFSATGQLWGNPLYNYQAMKKNGYKWWRRRIAHEMKLCDVLRIDHFRGFSEFWAIPADEQSAENGRWISGPGMKLVSALISAAPKGTSFIAEDLGLLSDEARELVEKSGFPGMKVLEFAFDNCAPSDYQPHRYAQNCVAYTGTHDNNTTMGWMGDISEDVRNYAVKYLALNRDEGWHIGMIRALYSSCAGLVIVPIQDYIGMGSDARINIPSTKEGNWRFRLDEKYLSNDLIEKMSALTRMYDR